ncbi:MAG: hypothetical protein LAN71_00670 [Acidobacteriia bacterium]|nr:hypothetical protein [Terriglobia bacterium]
MEAISGSGFWSTPKPYCSFCGWNLNLARGIERKSLKQLPWGFLFITSFYAALRYVFKIEFPFFFVLIACVFLIFGAIVSWRRLKLLKTSHPEEAYTNVLPSVKAAQDKAKQARRDPYQHLQILLKPRQVRLKSVPRAIAFAFPISWIFIVYFGYLIVRDQIAASGALSTSGNLAAFLWFTFIWALIAIPTIRSARRDRRLLAEGDLAMATITHQELTSGKHRRSEIHFQFRDAAGKLALGEGTDDSRLLYEDMEIPVFYNPDNPLENVALATASCELVEF